MKCAEWTEADWDLASGAFDRNFPNGRGMGVWTAAAVTDRDWAGTAKGLSSVDTRIQFKNNAEYHGMEVHAWQYTASAMYREASDHFYTAAFWREVDAESIGDSNPEHAADPGHHKAITMCIRMARFCLALANAQESRSPWPRSTQFGLEPEWVEERESKAQRQIDAAT